MGNIVAQVLGEEKPRDVRLTVAEKQALAGLGFRDSDIKKLIKQFQSLDEEKKGKIYVKVLTERIGINAPFVERIVDVSYGQTVGILTFFDFALSLWNFCTLQKSQLIGALFACYDRDSNGTLSVTELSDLSKELTPPGKNLGPRLKSALAKFDNIITQQEKIRYENNLAKAKQRLQNASGSPGLEAVPMDEPTDIRISPEFLEGFIKKNQALSQPLLQFHMMLRQETLGANTWDDLQKKLGHKKILHS